MGREEEGGTEAGSHAPADVAAPPVQARDRLLADGAAGYDALDIDDGDDDLAAAPADAQGVIVDLVGEARDPDGPPAEQEGEPAEEGDDHPGNERRQLDGGAAGEHARHERDECRPEGEGAADDDAEGAGRAKGLGVYDATRTRAGVHHCPYFSLFPRITSKNMRDNSMVMGPGSPPPTRRRSISVTGVR